MLQKLNYICCGDYYIPDIRLTEENRPIGRRGRMHRDEQKKLFSRYTDCVRELQTMTDCLLFQNSFRLGARMMLEGMEE